LSGPLLDRLDLLVGLRRIALSEMTQDSLSESSESVAQRVETARALQVQRGVINRDLNGDKLFSSLGWSSRDQRFAVDLAERSKLSMRAFQKWLKVARTLADLKGLAGVGKEQLLVARSLRFSLGDPKQVA